VISRASAVLGCFAVALGLFASVIAITGGHPGEVLHTLATGGADSVYGFTETVVKAIPVLLCALAAAVPGRLGLVNIGGEGQFLVGAIGATFVANTLPGMPAVPMLFLMALGAGLSGAAWGLLPGLLRGFTRANETVISLLLNYVAGLLVLHLIHGPWKDPAGLGWPQTALLSESARLAGLWGTRIHVTLLPALVLCALLYYVARHTTVGMASRLIEANPVAGRYIGLKVPLYYAIAFGIGGLIAGVAGFGELSAIQGRLRDGMSLGYGYAGFFVAWLCRNRFEWLPPGALLFAAVITGADSLQVLSGMPFATVFLLQGLFFLAILASPAVANLLRQRPTGAPWSP
jgi:general nucleoside transport system permease protein